MYRARYIMLKSLTICTLDVLPRKDHSNNMARYLVTSIILCIPRQTQTLLELGNNFHDEIEDIMRYSAEISRYFTFHFISGVMKITSF